MTVKLMRSAVIDAPVAAVWSLLRDFNGHDQWHPAIASSAIEAGEPSDMVGAIRAFRLQDGGFLREQLIALSDREMSLTYCLIEAPIPLHDYVARMQLRPVTDGDSSFLLWESSFQPPADRAADLAAMVATSIYEAGLQALQNHFRPTIAQTRSVIPAPAVQPAPMVQNAAVSGTHLPTEAIVVEHFGGPEVLIRRNLDVPPPAPGEIRIRHTAIGVNFIDIHCRKGEFDLLGSQRVPGAEGVGTVLDIGSGVGHLAPGDRVAYTGLPLGSYAAIRNLPAEIAIRLPADIDDRDAAALFLKGLFADALLHDVHAVQPGETILVRAAAGGLGLLLIQIAKHRGARVIGAVSSAAKAEAAGEAGCDHVIVTDREDLASALIRLTESRGVDAIFDGIGGATFDESLAALAVRGHLVSFGQAAGPVGIRDIDALAARSLSLSRPNFAHFVRDRDEIEMRAQRVFGLLRAGYVRPIFITLPLAEAEQAHRRLEARENIGAVVLIP